jgi:hypothetical protein
VLFGLDPDPNRLTLKAGSGFVLRTIRIRDTGGSIPTSLEKINAPGDPVLLNGLLIDPAEVDGGGRSSARDGRGTHGTALTPAWSRRGGRDRQPLVPCTHQVPLK